jgi:lipopolysaccharide transport system permease protein
MRESIALPYPVFAFSGLLLWNVFAGGLLGAGTSLVGNAAIIQKVYFPRLVIPISAIMVSLFDFLVALPVLGALILWFGYPPRATAPLYFLAGIVLAVLGTLGAGSALAALCVKYRDFRYILPFLIQLLLFATPVIYPISYANAEWARRVLALNPMSGAIGLFRSMFSGAPIDPGLTAISIASAGVLLLLGLGYFRRTEAYFADLA